MKWVNSSKNGQQEFKHLKKEYSKVRTPDNISWFYKCNLRNGELINHYYYRSERCQSDCSRVNSICSNVALSSKQRFIKYCRSFSNKDVLLLVIYTLLCT